jgi:hypothetical protein
VEAASTSSKPTTETSLGTRNPASRKAKNRSHRGHVVEGEERTEVPPSCSEAACQVTSEPGPGPGSDTLKLHHELRMNGDIESLCLFDDRVPAPIGIGTEGLPLDERNLPVTKFL